MTWCSFDLFIWYIPKNCLYRMRFTKGKKNGMEAWITKGESTKRYQENTVFYLRFCNMMQVHSYYFANLSIYFSEYWDTSKPENLKPVFFILSTLNFLSRFKFWKHDSQKQLYILTTTASGNNPHRIFFFLERVIFYQINLFKIFRLNTDQVFQWGHTHWLTSWTGTWRSLLPSSDWSRKRFKLNLLISLNFGSEIQQKINYM